MAEAMPRLHVETCGDGPPLVLLHGWAMHGGIFAPLVEALRTQRTLHVVDLPGHGHSRDGVPLDLDGWVAEVAAAVPTDAPWCGWSLGGLVALQAASGRVRMPALAVLCATPRFIAGDGWSQGMPAQVFHDFADGLHADWRATVERFIALEAFGSDHMREELQMLRDAVLERGKPLPEALSRGLDLLKTADLRPALPGLPMPSLWLAGRRDRLVDPRAMRAAAQQAPGARFVQVEQAGHAPFLTHVDEVAGALLGFLDGAGA